MYRKRRTRRSFPSLPLLLVAALAGLIFFLLDNATRPEADQDTPTPASVSAELTAEPETLQAPEQTPEPTLPEAAEAVAQSEEPDARPNVVPDIPANTMLFIPRAGIRATIVEAYLGETTWDVSRLGTNVGHLQGTSRPGERGNVVLSGHVEMADGRQGVFANLTELREGDLLILNSAGEEWRYVVESVSDVEPSDLTPVYPSIDDRLTLITCDGYNFLTDMYTRRIVVVALKI